MTRYGLIFAATALAVIPARAQTATQTATRTTTGDPFKLALPEHKGQLRWSAGDFKVV